MLQKVDRSVDNLVRCKEKKMIQGIAMVAATLIFFGLARWLPGRDLPDRAGGTCARHFLTAASWLLWFWREWGGIDGSKDIASSTFRDFRPLRKDWLAGSSEHFFLMGATVQARRRRTVADLPSGSPQPFAHRNAYRVL